MDHGLDAGWRSTAMMTKPVLFWMLVGRAELTARSQNELVTDTEENYCRYSC